MLTHRYKIVNEDKFRAIVDELGSKAQFITLSPRSFISVDALIDNDKTRGNWPLITLTDYDAERILNLIMDKE